MKRTPLKQKTPLRAKIPIKKVSKKQSIKNGCHSKVKAAMKQKMMEEHGYLFCQECGQKEDSFGLSLHHKIFRSHGGENSESNGQLLCLQCHQRSHNLR